MFYNMLGGEIMKISEFSDKSNVSIDTIRYYEKLGLLKVDKQSNNRKEYTDNDLKQLKLVLTLKKLGLSLNDIVVLFKLNEIYDNASDDFEEKLSIIKESKSILSKAYNNLLVLESEIKVSKKLLEKTIKKIENVLEGSGDLPWLN